MADSRECFPRRYKYYEILEISRNATQEEINRAFRRLAQKYHPDRNPGDSEAEAKFKKINEAYQVLSNPTERAAYDNSSAECPVCWTHEVIQISGNNWRCRHCGCQFDVFGSPLSETIERAAIPERHRVRLTAFQSMQCSWCRRFFTQEPFLCPYRQLHSSCFFFKKLSEEERDKFLNDERWWRRIVDLVRWTENNGVIKKCTKCGALNPNPEKLTCWQCGHHIYDRCPNCDLPTLYFDLDDNYWKCSNAKCYGKKFTFEKQAARYSKRYEQGEEYASQGVESNKCPECGHDLRFDSTLLLWRCTNRKCKRVYTYEELREARVRRSTSYHSDFQSKDSYTSKYYNENWIPYTPPRRKSRKILKIIGITLTSILAILMVIIAIDPFSPSLSVSPLSLCFTVDNGLNPPAETLDIRSSRGAVSWSATDDAQWLSLVPASGSTNGDTITLSADISGMHPGEYAANVTISAPDAKNTPLEVPVNLVITETSETLAIKETLGASTGEVGIYWDEQAPYSKGLGYTNINLINDESATDPTWQDLVQFMVSDDTDGQTYIPGAYMCGSFAETLHNNAEESGIRAAWVAIDLGGGKIHALNAFDTTDEGIVFVDCTGGGFEVIPSSSDAYSYDIDYDKIAYIQVGKGYGLINLDKAKSPSYGFYEGYMQDWQDYERGVDEYNRLLGGRTAIYDYNEYMKLKRMYDRLESQRKILGDYYWQPLGITSHVEIYW